MENTPKILLKIKQIYPALKGNYRLVADAVLSAPELMMSKKVEDIAHSCECDPAQVVRFCQRLGYRGFGELKSELAAQLIPIRTEVRYESLKESGSFARLRADFHKNYLRVMNDTMELVNEKDMNAAVKLIHGASRIMTAGSGASETVADDFYVKLFRMGFSVFHHREPDMNRMGCAFLGKKDLLIAVSFSGENELVLEYESMAKENGAKIIALTNYPESSVAKKADLTLLCSAEEQKLRLGVMTSRIAQFLVLDFLAVLLALEEPEKTDVSILKTYQAIQRKKKEK